jgi:hypothetical protein
MDDSTQTNLALLDRQLESLRASIAERPMPGLADAETRASRTRRRRPVQIGVFAVGVAALVAVLVLYGIRPTANGSGPPKPAHPGESAIAMKIDRIAQREGSAFGDPDITSDSWALTSGASANSVFGTTVIVPRPVYVVEIMGSFSGGPEGTAADPSRCVQRQADPISYIVVYQSTLDVQEVDLSPTPIDLAKLGQVHTDSFPAPPGASPPTTSPAYAACVAQSNAKMAEAQAFLSLEAAGAAGTFTVTYAVPGDKNGGIAVTLTVAHVATTHSRSPRGTWMFDLHDGSEADLWIVRPGDTYSCYLASDGVVWTCSHIAADVGGNGWILSAAAYEPYTVLTDMQSLVLAASGGQITRSSSFVAGVPVECLAIRGIGTTSACITSDGVLASFSTPRDTGNIAGDALAYGTATSITYSVSPSLLTPPAKADPGPWRPATPSCQLVGGCNG